MIKARCNDEIGGKSSTEGGRGGEERGWGEGGAVVHGQGEEGGHMAAGPSDQIPSWELRPWLQAPLYDSH